MKTAVERELSPTQMKVASSRAQAMRPDLRRRMIAKEQPEPLVPIVPLCSASFFVLLRFCRPTLDHNCPSVWAMIATVRDERCDRIGEGLSCEQYDNG